MFLATLTLHTQGLPTHGMMAACLRDILIYSLPHISLPVSHPSTIHHTQSALEFCPIHCPNGRLGQDLGFGGFAFALKLPELLNTNLAAVRAKLGQRSCFPIGPQIWFPIMQ